MFYDIGSGDLIRQERVVGVFDLDTATISKHTRDFLKKAEQDKLVSYTQSELPKSFVLCAGAEKTILYLSHLNTQTILKKRL